MSFWIELHCDRRHPGCRTDKGDIFGMKASSTGDTPVTMRAKPREKTGQALLVNQSHHGSDEQMWRRITNPTLGAKRLRGGVGWHGQHRRDGGGRQ
jgi:hypothetical protein